MKILSIIINQRAEPLSDLLCEIPVAGYIAAGHPIELVDGGETIASRASCSAE